jgi:tRNA dimethylallyltransferase
MPAIPLILVLGPTASGKSALALALAERLGGEVVSADAMAVYREMDIGTAKPGPAELARAPHHLVSVLDPSDRCDVQRWLGLAERAIAGIHARGRAAIVAGGSPLYTKALVEGLSAGAPRDDAVRAELTARYDAEGPEAAFAELARLDPVYAAQRHANDRQRVVRALEVIRLTGRPYSSFHTTDGIPRDAYRTLRLGLQWERDALHRRINARAKAMFASGLIDEVRALAPRLSPEAAQAVGYKEVIAHLAGEYDRERAEELVRRNSRHLAKHQLTWYRRSREIVWLPGDAPDLADRAEQLARAFLTPV